MTIEIPNVKCEKCSLQLLFLMTDKTVNCGTEYCNYYENDDNCIGHVDEKEGICAGAVPSSGIRIRVLVFIILVWISALMEMLQ